MTAVLGRRSIGLIAFVLLGAAVALLMLRLGRALRPPRRRATVRLR